MSLEPPDPHAKQQPYGLDDLVAHEKRNMRLVLVVLLLAMAYYALGGRPPTWGRGDAAPVTSR